LLIPNTTRGYNIFKKRNRIENIVKTKLKNNNNNNNNIINIVGVSVEVSVEGVTVMDESGGLDLIYDIYHIDDKSELGVMWNFVLDGFAREKCSINQDTLGSIIDFVGNVSKLCETEGASIDVDLLCRSSKLTQRKRQLSLRECIIITKAKV
jgi:hypothetical protein